MKNLTRLFFTLILISGSSIVFAQGSGGRDGPLSTEDTKFKTMQDFMDEVDRKGKPNGARKEFANAFAEAQEALTADKPNQAKVYIEKLHRTPKPNKYEESRIYLMDYWYQGKLGNKDAENEAATKLMQIGAGNIDPDVYVEAGIRLFKRQYNAKNFGGAIDTLAALRKEPKSQPELDAIATAVKQLDDITSGNQDLVQQIKTDEQGKWSTKLLRPTFFMEKINGEVSTVDFNCENKQASLNYKAESVMSTPPAWGSCNVKINATPNTTFNFVQLVNKPAA